MLVHPQLEEIANGKYWKQQQEEEEIHKAMLIYGIQESHYNDINGGSNDK